MFSQSSKFQPKRLATAIFIIWSIFFESGSNGPIISSIAFQSFNVMTTFLYISQTRISFSSFGL